ncbi:MAG: hypothetical protein JSV25_04755 [Spirochaetota bacterium]|nr:MAG: hypothetical protein JSV25_04755 [Spirochaetota bacterium]
MGKSDEIEDMLFSEIINKAMLEYCKRKGYEYSDYEFALFYGIRQNEDRLVGVIAGEADSSFFKDVSLRLQEIS